MRKGAKRLIGTLALTGGIGVAALASTTPAQAESCFWEKAGQKGSSKCFRDNVQDFRGMTFPNGKPMSSASSWQNKNTVLNEYAYSDPNYGGQEQELEDETSGNLDKGINNTLGSFDAN
ncbi:hypothetical protein [Actinomadura sp. 6N118]|uniref:hypothetical protein n=1 Tax=Actinomadura sp. 6N118 TaxID=3375151 RepID=UPI0037B88D3C